MQNQKNINLHHFSSVITNLTFKACQFAKECAENPDLKKFEKGKDDPVTQADFKIQTMLIRGINHYFPGLRIVGQQTTDYKGSIDLNMGQMGYGNSPQDFKNTNYDISQLCVWIDPIDNTKGFIKGNLDCVTVLVGLSRNNKAEFGVIGLPYRKENLKCIFEPEVLVGSKDLQKAFSTKGEQKWQKIQKQKLEKPPRFVATDSRINPQIKQTVEAFKGTLSLMGGSGKKNVEIIKGNSDALLYIVASNCKWDSCAGEAIIQAMGGFFSDYCGEELRYHHEESFKNDKGNIVAMDENLWKQIIDYIGNNIKL